MRSNIVPQIRPDHLTTKLPYCLVESTRPSKILREGNYEFSFKIMSNSLRIIRVNGRRFEVKHEPRRTIEPRTESFVLAVRSFDNYKNIEIVQF